MADIVRSTFQDGKVVIELVGADGTNVVVTGNADPKVDKRNAFMPFAQRNAVKSALQVLQAVFATMADDQKKRGEQRQDAPVE